MLCMPFLVGDVLRASQHVSRSKCFAPRISMTSAYGPIVATGAEWIGNGVGSSLFAIHALLADVQQEIHVLAYSITSGSDELLHALRENLARGICVTMVINRIDEQQPSVTKVLREMTTSYKYFRLYSYEAAGSDLHAKAIVVDRNRGLIGSSNFSARGMHHNLELGAMVNGEGAWIVAGLVDRLIEAGAVRTWR